VFVRSVVSPGVIEFATASNSGYIQGMSASSSASHDTPLGPPGQAQWFIGRDGQQFGPVSENEFRKLIELGHLRPTDLVWREGWPEWRPAHVLLPDPPHNTRTPSQPPSSTPPRSAGTGRGEASHSAPSVQPAPREDVRGYESRDPHPVGVAPVPRAPAAGPVPRPVADVDHVRAVDRDEKLGGRGFRNSFLILLIVGAIATGVWFFLPQLINAVPNFSGNSGRGTASQALSTAPISGFAAEPESTDRMLQTTAIFQLLKRTHPDWYTVRVAEASGAVKSGASDTVVLTTLMQAVIKLRREHSENASAAPLGHLQAIGQSFVANLARMKTVGASTCFAFISNGEAAPGVVELFQHKDHTALLQRQLVAVFEAVEEGRKTPRVYPVPKQGDYDLLVTELQNRGWTQVDIQTFSDSRALAKSPPEKVCALVTEWFESQLQLKDPDVRLRLLVDSLRPMIAG
jgi:hypothetical protein